MGGASGDINGDDPDGFAPILNQWGLHNTHKCLAIRSNREAFHALVSDAAGRVTVDFCVTNGTQVADGELAGQCEGLEASATSAVELVHVRTVFVRDEHAFAVSGDANALRIEACIIRISRELGGVEVVRTAGEIVDALRV